MPTFTAQELQQKIDLRPTLLVGVGGTGQAVLVQLKARFLRNYGQMPPAVELVCFDTDQSRVQTQSGGQIVELTQGTELINIGGIQTASVLRNLDNNKAIAAWITEDKERMPTNAIIQGARQVRPLGRLSLFWNVGSVYNKIKGAVARLTDMKLRSKETGINVFVVSSVCGGTGSGAFLDVAYLVRKAIDDAGIPGSFCYVNGILALPSVFPTVQDQVGIQANAYASLRELDFVMESGDWKIDYGNAAVGTTNFVGQPPFNICYLVDARNERGYGLTGLEEIAPMVAEAVYLQISSQVGAASRSAFDNVSVLTGKTMFTEENKSKLTAYSGLGTASLVFAATSTIELCANRLSVEFITRLLRFPLVDGKPNPLITRKVEEAAINFEKSELTGIDALLQQLARNAKGDLVKVALEPRALDMYKESEMFSGTQAYVSKSESMLDNDYSTMLDLNRKALSDRLAKAISDQADRLAEEPDSSLNAAVSFVDTIDARLNQAKLDAERSKGEWDQRRVKAQALLRQLQEAFTASFKTFPMGRGNKVREARNAYVSMYQSHLGARFEVKKREVAVGLLSGLAGRIAVKRSKLQNLANRLQLIQTQCQSFVDRSDEGKLQADSVLAESITSKADINAIYESHLTRLGERPETALMENKGPLRDWADLDQDEVAMRVLAFGREWFADLRDITVESIINDKNKLVDTRKRLQDLVSNSVPFWSYQKERLTQEWQDQRIVVVGVRDKETSIYKSALEEGQQLTSTFDPHTITVLQTKHGLPLFALTQYPNYKEKHDKVMRDGLKPLYVLPEVRPGGEKAKLYFALGLAYGFVFRSGAYYFVTPEDAAYQPAQLSQGMAESLRSFRNDVEIVALVTRQVDTEMDRTGRDATTKMLEDYIRTPYVCELRGASKVNIDRDKMNKDTSVAEPGRINFDLLIELRETLVAYVKKVLKA